ncbi:MAG: glycoside hydrolase family 43 protein [Spirochaetaceae bacterium]|nr:glycoside hydrolase family 43 protein [Spirochaetaceae bacterium]
MKGLFVMTGVMSVMGLCSCAATLGSDALVPAVSQRADPWVTRGPDGRYYFTATVPEYDSIEIRRADSLAGLSEAKEVTVWRRHDSGSMGAHIWAPELHFIEGAWYVYFAAAPAEDQWHIRTHVLRCTEADPIEGTWEEMGRLDTGWDSFNLDATTFDHRGHRYLVWAQKDRSLRGNSNLYIAPMDGPLRLAGPAVMLSTPEYPWEKILYWVNEGPAVLVRNGRVLITYSASGTDANYCMGLLSAPEDADLLDPSSWTKSEWPVFAGDAEAGLYGPGHSCWVESTDGTEVWLVYHARDYERIEGKPLDDPNRHTWMKKIEWDDDGKPIFGKPSSEIPGF